MFAQNTFGATSLDANQLGKRIEAARMSYMCLAANPHVALCFCMTFVPARGSLGLFSPRGILTVIYLGLWFKLDVHIRIFALAKACVH